MTEFTLSKEELKLRRLRRLWRSNSKQDYIIYISKEFFEALTSTLPRPKDEEGNKIDIDPNNVVFESFPVIVDESLKGEDVLFIPNEEAKNGS